MESCKEINLAQQVTAKELFDRVLEWFRLNYGNYDFFMERDVEWTLHQKFRETVASGNLPFEVFNNFPIMKGDRRGICTDLAILNMQGKVEVAVELKFEPDHQRGFGPRRNVWPTRLNPSVVFWKAGVEKDVERAQQYVSKGKAKMAVTMFVDEGGLFRHRRPPSSETKWVDWKCGGSNPRMISLLIGFFVTC
jgi:hypothetical protein